MIKTCLLLFTLLLVLACEQEEWAPSYDQESKEIQELAEKAALVGDYYAGQNLSAEDIRKAESVISAFDAEEMNLVQFRSSTSSSEVFEVTLWDGETREEIKNGQLGIAQGSCRQQIRALVQGGATYRQAASWVLLRKIINRRFAGLYDSVAYAGRYVLSNPRQPQDYWLMAAVQ